MTEEITCIDLIDRDHPNTEEMIKRLEEAAELLKLIDDSEGPLKWTFCIMSMPENQHKKPTDHIFMILKDIQAQMVKTNDRLIRLATIQKS